MRDTSAPLRTDASGAPLAPVERALLLDGEDPRCDALEDAANWVRVYAQLLLNALRASEERSPVGGRSLKEEVEWLGQQLTFWKARCREIAERYP